MLNLTIPYRFNPRRYQLGFFKAIDSGIKRVLLIWPRRHGKDKSCFNALISQAVKRVANYYYIFPEYNQGRKALWDNIDKDGMRTIDHIPKEILKSKNSTEMKIELTNGSIIQIVGAADIDRIVGTNPAGVVFSEYSLIDPMVWGFIYPILAENKGFAWFNMTPRGNNHAKRLLESAQNNPEYYVSHLNAKQCEVFSLDELEKIRSEYFELYGDYQLYDQEFMTSFDSPIQGAYYAVHMERAKEDGRITNVPYEPNLPVHTFWDLGVGDSTAIWFMQAVGREIRLIDYYESSGEGIPHYVKVLKEKPYIYGGTYWPHDGTVREFGSGLSRIETAEQLGLKPEIVANQSIEDGIEAVRSILSRCWFDSTNCEHGIDCLTNYHKEFDEDRKVYKNKPYHDWSSHGSDAFRYLAVGFIEKLDSVDSYISRPYSQQPQKPIAINGLEPSTSIDAILNRGDNSSQDWML